ncbi:MAG: cysteine dioxygenase [Rhodospirillaceae bacterium]|jgi:predicted metal-dependent enzyme (double-stranded beta helix superfamily)|nr:cysteine dioxygenase [Rhodospirillaceae bacterium]MBT6119428.1 cysteine dioxygenase [Rhodospirillaceae bacterium]
MPRNQRETAAHRSEAVAETVERIQGIEQADGVDYPSLEKIGGALFDLAARKDLFPADDFPLGPNKASKIYLLQEDPDGRFALYMSVGTGGKLTPPHDHTTWAVIVSVQGRELNLLFDRLDDGSVPGKAEIVESGRKVVEGRTAVCLLPDDIHAVALEGDEHAMLFHMYGLGLDRLDRRIAFNQAEGTYRKFPAGPIVK